MYTLCFELLFHVTSTSHDSTIDLMKSDGFGRNVVSLNLGLVKDLIVFFISLYSPGIT